METMVKQLFQLSNLESQFLIESSLRRMHQVSYFAFPAVPLVNDLC
jgi:hypothetical protein